MVSTESLIRVDSHSFLDVLVCFSILWGFLKFWADLPKSLIVGLFMGAMKDDKIAVCR